MFSRSSIIAVTIIVFNSFLVAGCGSGGNGRDVARHTVDANSAVQHKHDGTNTAMTTEDSTSTDEKRSSGESFVQETAKPADPNTSAPTEGQQQVQRIVLKTVEYQLIFDQDIFSVKAGMPVEIEFINVDEMPHNLLIIIPGSLERVGEAADKMSRDPNAAKIQFVPQTSDVLYSTPLLMIDQSYTLRFTAPKEPGDYPYVCTYPGHWRSMKGIMKVTK